MSRYLLDTNILSSLVAQPRGIVAEKIAALPEGACCTSVIAAAELRFGAARRNAPRLTHAVQGVLARLPVETFGEPADATYADLRARLERGGRPLAANDLLIATHALVLDCVLVSDDRAFENIEGLTVENWLR